MGKTISEMLREYADGGTLPMHMPGHKRNTEAFPYLSHLGGGVDITEIDSFDDLNCPCGIFEESEKAAAKLWGSDGVIYSVNGSSGAVLASVRAATRCRRGQKIILSRASHKSVYHAIELCGAVPVYLAPEVMDGGILASVTPEQVRLALDASPDTALVIITSPTYEGVISDIRGISQVCHERGIPLMVDEAHGAHLGLYGIFPDGAVRCGADISVQSFHKTLPSLTQTAAIHYKRGLISEEEIRRQMALFQTSSPSYLLSASIDGAVRYLSSDEGEERLRTWYGDVLKIRERLYANKSPRLFTGEGAFALDVSKLVLIGDGFGIMRDLRDRFNIELEMASVAYAVAMTGAGDSTDTLERFADAVERLKGGIETVTVHGRIHIPMTAVSIDEAVSRSREAADISASLDRVSADYIYAYPPGVPLVVPGEVIDRETIASILGLLSAGFSLRGVETGKIRVLSQN